MASIRGSAAAGPLQPELPPEAKGIYYVDRELWPDRRWTLVAIRAANPLYAALESRLDTATAEQSETLRADLGRLRLIGPSARFVLVDTANERLWMVADGQVAGTMRVVTGKPGMDTPALAALIRFAVLNPYWHLPPDLVRERVSEHVLTEGAAWLRSANMEPVTTYAPDARPIDPRAVDWLSVASGKDGIGLRQRPGPDNMMGAVKFMFPNNLGIYLHDTPQRKLFRASSRRFSSGCVRLENAAMLYRWLFGSHLPPRDQDQPERQVQLPKPVPVFLLHLPSLARIDRSLPEARRAATWSGAKHA